jgi:hypothetical protein
VNQLVKPGGRGRVRTLRPLGCKRGGQRRI